MIFKTKSGAVAQVIPDGKKVLVGFAFGTKVPMLVKLRPEEALSLALLLIGWAKTEVPDGE